MATTFFGITNRSELDWDECRIALTHPDGSLKERLTFTNLKIRQEEIFYAEIPNEKLVGAKGIAYCGLRDKTRIFTGSIHNIQSIVMKANNSIAG
ncbi:MAG: hypothetical protein H7A40_07460 [Chlamydiales bacterium]|nr:hypothetical protein [Chlamydiales bacterium]